MTAPRPDQVQALLDDIVHTARGLGATYRWLEPSAHQRPRHGAHERSSGGGTSDIADEVAATSAVRGRIEWAARNVMDARNRLLTAQAALNDASNLLDPREAGPSVEERSLPHPADRGDLDRARKAQARRQDRAEASGDWAEVTG